MPVRVELIDEAVADLAALAESGLLPLFLKKLLRVEAEGKNAGLPLGRGLTGWRKIVVGDRNWRIVFTVNAEETVATVWVVGDREDAECYEQAQRRIDRLGRGQPQAASLAAAMLQILQSDRKGRKGRR